MVILFFSSNIPFDIWNGSSLKSGKLLLIFLSMFQDCPSFLRGVVRTIDAESELGNELKIID